MKPRLHAVDNNLPLLAIVLGPLSWPARDGLVLVPAYRPRDEARAGLDWRSAAVLREPR